MSEYERGLMTVRIAGVVGGVMLVTLLVGLTTGFYAVYPPMGIVVAIFSAMFVVIGLAITYRANQPEQP